MNTINESQHMRIKRQDNVTETQSTRHKPITVEPQHMRIKRQLMLPKLRLHNENSLHRGDDCCTRRRTRAPLKTSKQDGANEEYRARWFTQSFSVQT